jgi:hypothetical protein
VEVLLRIIEQPDLELMRKITVYTNSQNAVKTYDLIGTEDIQVDLKKRIERHGYFYETRRGDFKAKYPTASEARQQFGKNYKDKVIGIVEAAQAYAAFFLERPATAKSSTSSLFLSSSQGGHYDEIFNNTNVSPQKIIGCFDIVQAVIQKRKEIIEKMESDSGLGERFSWLLHADFFIVSLFHHQYFDSEQQGDDKYVESFFRDVKQNFETLYQDTIDKVADYMKERRNEIGYNHPKFFKSESGYGELKKLF